MSAAPLLITASVSRDAFLAEWRTFVIRDAAAALLATGLLLLTGRLWLSRRRRARLVAEAFDAVLAHNPQGVRVEGRDGTLLAANAAGLTLPPPEAATDDAPSATDDAPETTRHDLSGGARVLIGADAASRRAAEERIAFLTHHDRLTGLPNRWHATARIQELIDARPPVPLGVAPPDSSERTGEAAPGGETRGEGAAALILLDLDGFQNINDTLGHEAGDAVLAEVADRLRGLASQRDVVARLGGDEFLLFLDTPGDEAAVAALSDTIPRVLSQPVAVRGQQVRLGASMGIALHPRDGADAATLLRHANIALSRAKSAGRGRAQLFAPALMASFGEHRMMESDLRRALEGDELELRLQPQFACATLDVTGFEALSRWRHPTRGEISPAVFIPIAERSGLINPLGLWALERTCAAAAGWRTRHRVAVNLSPVQLRSETLGRDIQAVLHRTQFPAHLLELEVTESVLMDEDQRILETLHRLRAQDIRITLDDFGTGYSSLSYLRRFPFDKIKIDKSFIRGAGIQGTGNQGMGNQGMGNQGVGNQGVGQDRLTRVILEAMIRMCSDLGLDVVAEGVETEQELAELRRLGCGEVQGFLLGRPMRTDAVEDFLATHARRPATMPREATAVAMPGTLAPTI